MKALLRYRNTKTAYPIVTSFLAENNAETLKSKDRVCPGYTTALIEIDSYWTLKKLVAELNEIWDYGVVIVKTYR